MHDYSIIFPTATDSSRRCILPLSSLASEAGRQACVQAAAGAVLRCAYAYAGTVAQQIRFIEQVDQCQTTFDLAHWRVFPGVGQCRVDGEVMWQVARVRCCAIRCATQAAAVQEVSTYLRIAEVVMRTARHGVGLVVVEVNVVLADVSQLIR